MTNYVRKDSAMAFVITHVRRGPSLTRSIKRVCHSLLNYLRIAFEDCLLWTVWIILWKANDVLTYTFLFQVQRDSAQSTPSVRNLRNRIRGFLPSELVRSERQRAQWPRHPGDHHIQGRRQVYRSVPISRQSFLKETSTQENGMNISTLIFNDFHALKIFLS